MANALSDAGHLTASDLGRAVEQAMAYWTRAGINTQSLDTLTLAQVQIVDLPGSLLGLAFAPTNTIQVDSTAAGFGWGRIDFPTVLAHEFGHLLGLQHDQDGVMGETLGVGVQHLSHLGDFTWIAAAAGPKWAHSPSANEAYFELPSSGNLPTRTSYLLDPMPRDVEKSKVSVGVRAREAAAAFRHLVELDIDNAAALEWKTYQWQPLDEDTLHRLAEDHLESRAGGKMCV
jgi:hypothetical protein